MAPNHPRKSRAIVWAALVAGFVFGCVVMSLGHPRLEFLGGNTPLAQRDEDTSTGHDTVTYYSMPADWLHVVDQARKELPASFEHDTILGGLRAKVLTIPRIENGRVQLFYPPAEEFTFFPRRLALNHSGRVVALTDYSHSWTGIQMRVYHPPKVFQSLVEWVQKNLKV